MRINEVLQHLEGLKTEAEGHYTDDGDDEVFHKDVEALSFAIDAVKYDAAVVNAIKSAIGTCNRDIRKANDDKLIAMERIDNLGDQKMTLEALLKIVGGDGNGT